MHSFGCLLASLVTVSQVAAVARVPHIRGGQNQAAIKQAEELSTRAPIAYVYNKTRADAVKQTFQISWDGYSKYAFPHDSLLPVSNGFQDDRYV